MSRCFAARRNPGGNVAARTETARAGRPGAAGARSLQPVALGASLALVALGASAAAHAQAAAAADAALSSQRRESELSRSLLSSPARCIRTDEATKQCVWRLGNRTSAWHPIAAAIGTDDRINVICTLPLHDEQRAARSCSAYPRRSDRMRYVVGHSRRDRRKRADTAQRRERLRQGARDRLARARGFDDLVALLGDLPITCAGVPGGDRTCVWKLDARTLGHGTVAAAAGLPSSKKLRLDCVFDGAGALRAPCAGRIDD